MKKNIIITKNDGTKERFSISKLRRSLERAGADQESIFKIGKEIKRMLKPGISTKEIYNHAFLSLKNISGHIAAKYKLKKAIMELGPSGFPFEKYIAAILKSEAYSVKVGQIVQGSCVRHEIDVIASKDNLHFMIECKFHGEQSRKCDVKIPLYINSRFLDVEKAWKLEKGHDTKFHQGWVVTNTRFTTDAEQYGSCAGLNLVSWNYPEKGSLKERIDRSGLHPLTCLTSLSKKEKQSLLDSGIVLCKELCENEQHLKKLGIQPSRLMKIITEAKLLCATKTTTSITPSN